MKKICLFVLTWLGLLLGSSWAAAPFYVYQKEVSPVEGELKVGMFSLSSKKKLNITVYKINDVRTFLGQQSNLHKLAIEGLAHRDKLNRAIVESKSNKKPKVHGKVADKQSLYTFVKTFTHTTRGSSSKKSADYEEVATGVKGRGVYLIEVQWQNYITYCIGQISDLALIVRRSAGEVLVYSVNRTTGRAAGGVDIHLFRGDQKLAQGTTDKTGIFRTKVAYFPKVRIYGEDNGHFTLCDPQYYPATVDGLKGLLFPDRPLYLPGETVRFKAIFRQFSGGLYSLPKLAKTGEYKVVGPRGQTVIEGKVAVSPVGSAHGGGKLPGNMTLGDHKILLTVSLQGGGKKTFAGQFKVEKFQKPKITVQVTPEKSAVVRGDKIKFNLQGSYYVGGPVEKGRVQYTLTRSRFSQPLFEESGMASFYSTQEFRSFQSQPVAKGKATLDEQGRLTLAFDTPKDLKHPHNYSLSVSVMDKTRSRAGGGGSVKVATAGFRLGVQAGKSLYKVEEDAFLTVKAVDLSGQPVKTKFQLTVVRRGRKYPKGGHAGARRHLPREKEVPDKILYTVEKETDDKGQCRFSTPLTKVGEIDLVVTAKDRRGHDIRSSISVWVEKGRTPVYYSGRAVKVIPDKKLYQVGDTARVMVILPVKGVQPLVTVEGESLVSHHCDLYPANTGVVEVKVTDKMVPNFYVTASAVWKGGYMESGAMLVVPPAKKVLQVKATFDKENYRPGEKAQVTVEVRDSAGRPVSTELALGVIDESLYAIASDRTPALIKFYYSLLRKNVGTGHSVTFDSYGYAQKSSRLPTPIRPAEKKEMKKGDSRPNAEESRRGGAGGAVRRPSPRPGESPPRRALNSLSAKKKKPAGKKKSEPKVARKVFKNTAHWAPAVKTDKEGRAVVTFTFPENLTRWRLTARVVDSQTRIGSVRQQVKTRLPLSVRLSLPAFLVEGDVVQIFGSVRNFQAQTDRVTLSLLGGSEVKLSAEKATKNLASGKALDLAAKITGVKRGFTTVTATAKGTSEGDKIERTLPVRPYGIQAFQSLTGHLRGDLATGKGTLAIPKGTDLSTARLVVRITPGYYQAVEQALPYLIGYPYGCVEQTMSRFIPDIAAADVFKTLRKTAHPRQDKLKEYVQAGLERLYQLQHKDGGWGWWRRGSSHPYMTAYVVWGMARANHLGYPVNGNILAKGIKRATAFLKDRNLSYAHRAYCLYAVASTGKKLGGLVDQLFDSKARLKANSATQALLVLAMVELDRKAEARIIAENLVKKAKKSQGTGNTDLVHWGEANRRRWARHQVEVTALVARALIAQDATRPEVTAALAWLLDQRQNGRWHSTRDTASAVEAFCAYLKMEKDLPEVKGKIAIAANSSKMVIDLQSQQLKATFAGSSLQVGENEINISVDKSALAQKGQVFYEAYLSYYRTDRPLPAQSTGFTVSRRYFKVVANEKTKKYQLVPVKGAFSPDDTIVVRLTVSTDKPRDFVMVEDFRPSTAQVIRRDLNLRQIGDGVKYATGDHREFLLDRTTFFFTRMEKGTYHLQYFWRPSLAGTFQVLPARAGLMYFPEISGHTGSRVIKVK